MFRRVFNIVLGIGLVTLAGSMAYFAVTEGFAEDEGMIQLMVWVMTVVIGGLGLLCFIGGVKGGRTADGSSGGFWGVWAVGMESQMGDDDVGGDFGD